MLLYTFLTKRCVDKSRMKSLNNEEFCTFGGRYMIQLAHIKKDYPTIQLDCSLEVSEGQVVGLIGDKDSGKTTLIKILLNLLHKDNGEYLVLGHDKLSIADKQDIGAVIGQASFSEYLRIKDIIPVMAKLYHSFQKQEFKEVCLKYGLPIKKQIRTLSLENQTLLHLLLALSHQPKLLVLDGLFDEIKPSQRDKLLKIIMDYHQQNPQPAILFTARDIENLEEFCDEMYVLDQGKTVYNELIEVMKSDYGILKMDDNQFLTIDKRYIKKVKKERYGYSCLTQYRQFYEQRYHETMIIEQGTIHQYIKMMKEGEDL